MHLSYYDLRPSIKFSTGSVYQVIKKAPAVTRELFRSSGAELHHATHTTHAAHIRHSRGIIFWQFRDHRFGGNHQRAY